MAVEKWKKIDSTQVFEHPRLNLYEDTVELPNGTRTSYIHLGPMPDASMVIPINNSGEVLLQKEYSYPPDEILLQFPGGLLHSEDSPESGAARELAEEAKLQGSLRKIGFFYPDNRRKSHKMHVFVATDLSQANAPADAEEFFEDFWYQPKQIDSLIREGEITNHTTLAAWALYRVVHG